MNVTHNKRSKVLFAFFTFVTLCKAQFSPSPLATCPFPSAWVDLGSTSLPNRGTYIKSNLGANIKHQASDLFPKTERSVEGFPTWTL